MGIGGVTGRIYAQKSGEKIYVQAGDDISNEGTFEREHKPHLKVRDAYPKMTITHVRHDEYTYEGNRSLISQSGCLGNRKREFGMRNASHNAKTLKEFRANYDCPNGQVMSYDMLRIVMIGYAKFRFLVLMSSVVK